MMSKITKLSPKNRRSQNGSALLIAIFTLLLIGAVAIGLIMMSLTQNSISANYKSSLQAFYNGKAGLEEGRGRLFGGNPNPLSALGFPNTLLANEVWYITNPESSETVDPQNLSSTYADNQYASEWNHPLSTSTVKPYVSSVASLSGTPNAPYKWVRITATTEYSSNIDGNVTGYKDPNNLLCFDGTQVFQGSPSACPGNSSQVFTVTSMAVSLGGGRRMEQYLVASQNPNLNLSTAMTVPANNVTFAGPNSNPAFKISGIDGVGVAPPAGGCGTGIGSIPAVGVTEPSGGNANKNAFISGIPAPPVTNYNNYLGGGLPTPSISDSISLPGSLQSPASINQMIQQVSNNADLVINHDATTTDIPSGMSAASPMTIVVNGNFNLTNAYTGYGLLIVTGNLTYTGDSGWKGIVVVAGKGTATFANSGPGSGAANEFDGSVFVATIKDASGNLLSNFGNVVYDLSNGGGAGTGNGIYSSSCWTSKAQQVAGMKVLAFKEIAN